MLVQNICTSMLSGLRASARASVKWLFLLACFYLRSVIQKCRGYACCSDSRNAEGSAITVYSVSVPSGCSMVGQNLLVLLFS